MRVPHIRFLLAHALGGVAVGLGAAALLVWLDIGRLGTLAAASPDGLIAIALLGFGFAVTFGSAAIGAAIMGQASGQQAAPPRGRLRRLVPAFAVPAFASPAPARRSR